MKVFDFIHRSAAAVLVVFVLAILSRAARADVFPVELLTEQAAFTNVRGAPVAISGDYMVAGVNDSLGGPRAATLFHRANGEWLMQGVWTPPDAGGSFGSSVAVDGGTLVVGDPSAANEGRTYVFAPTTQPALNAWSLEDHTSSSGVYYRYNHALTTNEQQLAAAEGWTLTVCSRMVDNFPQDGSPASCFVDYAVGPTNRFLVFFDLDADLNLTANLGGLETVTLTTNGAGWGNYHTHQIVYDPTNGTADYYFDGTKLNSSPWTPTPITGLNGVRFGNGSSSGEGGMNFNKVELRTHVTDQVLALYDAGTAGSPTVAPDPETRGWALVPDNVGPGIAKGPVSPDFASEWPLQAALVPDNHSNGQGFGQTVAISSNAICVGAPSFNDGSGEVYVFARNGSNWMKQASLDPVAGGSQFGTGLALDGDTAVVGAPNTGLNSVVGSAYVFVRSGTNWTLQQQLSPANPEAGSRFGRNVAIDGDRAAIGAVYENHANNYAGSVYIFDRSNAVWTQKARFFPNDYPNGEVFGESLALKGDVAVVSGFYYDRSYVFTRFSTNWVQAASIVYSNNPDASVRSVAFDGQDVVVSEGEQEGGSYGAVHVYTPSYTNAAAVAGFVSKLLYYPNAASTLVFDPDQAAFRYKALLYAADANGILARFTNMAELYSQVERDRADFAESQIVKGLAFHPDDGTLGNLLLDVYYDRSAADAIFANNRQAEADAAHFGPPIARPAPSGGFLIDNEVPLYQQVLDTNRTALSWYFSLLTNHLGVAGEPPLGYRIFQGLVPTRGLVPATYLDTNGVPESVTSNNAALFDDYKDLALLFNLLRGRGNTVDTLGRLLVARNNAGDADQARTLVSDAQRLLFLQGSLLKGIFPSLPPEGDASGIAEAVQGWSASLTSLAELQQILLGKENLLGFEPDFLMFAPRGNTSTALDSFDRFLSLLDPNDSSSQLGVASDRLSTALGAYTQFRGYQDEYAQQAADSTAAASERLAQIVGLPPSDSNYGNYPTGLPGSDLDQQYQSIQLARLRILKNKAEINNVNREVQIELNRAASVVDVVIDYGNQQASLTEQIGQLNAAQAAANQLTDYLNPANLLSGASIAIALNFGAQTAAELSKADLEAQKERLAATEQATIEGINSAAHVKTLLLQFNTLVVDSQEATVLMQQELGRMTALYREKARLEAQLAQSKADLSTRFFADPVHRLTTLADMQTADFAFDEARKWMFYLTRSFEYKWNTTFTNNYLGRSWAGDSVLKCQNASELTDLYLALKNKDETIALNLPAPQEAQTSFSVRQDFFGLLDGQTYVDPNTGQTVSAIEAFRRRLRTLLATNLTDVRLNLDFGTVRQKSGSSFFLGARFDTFGNVVSPGRYLDKINWLKIKISGSNLPSSQTIGDLTYGGTSYIRKQTPGTLDLVRPDLVMNEMTAYSTRYWYFDTALNRYRFKDAFASSGVPIELSPISGGEPTVLPIYDFTERSVAASGWLLSIELQNGGAELDKFDDIELFFDHRSVTRQ